jgi:hypothetical protein
MFIKPGFAVVEPVIKKKIQGVAAKTIKTHYGPHLNFFYINLNKQ